MTDDYNFYVGVKAMVHSANDGLIVKRFEVPVSDYSEFDTATKALVEARRQRDKWLRERKEGEDA